MRHQKIAVCDDEKASLNTISKYIEKTFMQYGIEYDIHIFQSVSAILKFIQNNTCDICFLDIDMPEMNGIDLAEQICQKNAHILIVFVSGKEEYVFQSFRAHPFSFVRKAYFQDDMTSVVKDIVQLLYKQESEQQSCKIIDKSGYEHLFLLDSICYLEAKESYVNIILDNTKILIRCSMKSLEKQLESNGFIRCHKSYIVNVKKVYAVKHDHLIMMDKTELPIRRGMVTEIKKQLCRILVH